MKVKAEVRCPYCDSAIPLMSEVRGKPIRPSPGDWSICICCGGLLVFDKELTPSLPSVTDLAALHANPKLDQLLKESLETLRAVKSKDLH